MLRQEFVQKAVEDVDSFAKRLTFSDCIPEYGTKSDKNPAIETVRTRILSLLVEGFEITNDRRKLNNTPALTDDQIVLLWKDCYAIWMSYENYDRYTKQAFAYQDVLYSIGSLVPESRYDSLITKFIGYCDNHRLSRLITKPIGNIPKQLVQGIANNLTQLEAYTKKYGNIVTYREGNLVVKEHLFASYHKAYLKLDSIIQEQIAQYLDESVVQYIRYTGSPYLTDAIRTQKIPKQFDKNPIGLDTSNLWKVKFDFTSSVGRTIAKSYLSSHEY